MGDLVKFEREAPERAVEIRSLPDMVGTLEVTDHATRAMVGEVLTRIAASRKSVEEFYAPRKAAARQVWQQLVDDEKMFLAPVVEAERLGKQKISEFDTAEKKRAEEAMARIEMETGVRMPVAVIQPRVSGVTTRDQWRWRVTNASLVPRDYLTLDEKKIGAVVRAFKDSTNIPGIEVYSETAVSVRAKGGTA